ncbi:MAG: TetR/AcrR family transcriptional regulator [Anaerolineae bacterium]
MITDTSPRQRRHNKTKESILQAARELIAEKGIDGLSLRALAHRIDYSPSGLYEYFHSKDELVTAVCAEGMERLNDYLTSVPADLPPTERLFKMGLAYLDFARQNPEHFRLIFTDIVAPATAFDEPPIEGDPYQTLLQAVQDAIETGAINLQPGYHLHEIAYTLWALVHGMAMLEQTHLRYVQTDFDTIHRHALEIFAAGFQTKKLSER